MACAGCTGEALGGEGSGGRRSDLVTIRMRIAGEEVTFRRCARCESNVWEAGAGRISLESVLDLARVTR